MNKTFLFDALREATDEEMQRDKSVFVLGEDVGHYGGSYKVTKDLHVKYGDIRVLDTPIAENSFMGMAIGSAMTGLRPIVEGMNMSFLLLAFNQISNNAGMLRYTSGGNFNIPLVIRGPGGVGKQLGAEHSQRLEAYFQAIPGLKIVACSTPYNAKGLLKSAIRDQNPVIFFEHVLLYNLQDHIPEDEYFIPLDKAELVRSGEDVTIVTYSRMRYHVLKALDILVEDGYNPEIIDLISLKPLDIDSIISSLKKTNRLLIVEECMKTGGIAAEIIAQVNDDYFDLLDAPIVRLSSQDIPTPYNGNLEKATVVQPQHIVEAVKKLLY
uniref:Pyruvate dehydrogenase E1 component subunit beta n=1 Tax=Herposiphonia versicolor TaxID=2007163 RepID=A0A1Z1MFL7_9FLOR|nr:pyruvate dehydrogenase E1 component beta subunit [Herposiphonia versicolor]ARW64783.1 pyruvate dehydrogenase E1 component beta subunit [Herposiphonia versicolor]